MRRADRLEIGAQVGYEIVEAVDLDARPFRPAMPPVIQRRDGVPALDHRLGDVRVANAVLADAVGYHHHGARIAIRQPPLCE